MTRDNHRDAFQKMSDQFQQEYEKLTWKCWPYKAGGFASLKQASPPIPHERGVYLFRAPHPICRVKGKSDVIYIGQSGGGKRGGAQGIGAGNGGPGRLFNKRGQDKVVREYIESLFPQEDFLVECYFTANDEDAEETERRLLLAYLRTHFELPPANHTLKKSVIAV